MKNFRRSFACLIAGSMCATAAAQTLEWVREYNGPASNFDGAFAIAVDGAGNVYVGGGSEAPGGVGNEDYATVKYAPDGTPSATWPDVGFGVGVRRYDFVNSFDRVQAITVDELGNMYVTGIFINQGGGLNYDWGTLAYDASGNLLWVTTYGAPLGGGERANHIALDGLGQVYVSGYTVLSANAGQDYCTIKYDAATGQPSASWPDVGFGVGVRVYHKGSLSAEKVLAMVVDDSGNVYVTGQSSFDYATIKYDAAGIEVWVARYDSGSADGGNAIALDEAGAVYVTGRSGFPHSDYTTLKYDANGALSADWPDVGHGVGVRVYDGLAAGDDYAVAIGVDSTGHTYVTGRSEGIDTGDDFATIK